MCSGHRAACCFLRGRRNFHHTTVFMIAGLVVSAATSIEAFIDSGESKLPHPTSSTSKPELAMNSTRVWIRLGRSLFHHLRPHSTACGQSFACIRETWRGFRAAARMGKKRSHPKQDRAFNTLDKTILEASVFFSS